MWLSALSQPFHTKSSPRAADKHRHRPVYSTKQTVSEREVQRKEREWGGKVQETLRSAHTLRRFKARRMSEEMLSCLGMEIHIGKK